MSANSAGILPAQILKMKYIYLYRFELRDEDSKFIEGIAKKSFLTEEELARVDSLYETLRFDSNPRLEEFDVEI